MAATAATGRAYEDFVPPHNTVTEPATHTLSVDLTAAGYKKEHVRVQLVRSHGLVVVRGERPLAGNRWSRFRLEFPVPDGCDFKGIHARFEGGVVRVIMPGLKAGPAAVGDAGEQVPAAAKTGAAAGAQDGGVAREKAGGHAQGGGGGEKEDESVQKQQEAQRASAAVKDGGRLDGGAGAVGGEEAVASPSRRGGYTFLSERRKLVITVIGAVLVLLSLGIYVRYSFGP